MAIEHQYPPRESSNGALSAVCLEDKFELIKEIGDGSFGSVALARVRTAGAYIARRGTLVAIKTMKKTFDSFAPCLELREIIFLRSLPMHAHLVPALDIFLDPTSKKLHICMENMDGNLYQLMKARDHRCLDGSSVKSILFQILSGLDHIHAHNFFHRDIKPENILVSTTAPMEANTTLRRYSALVTPPATPPLYVIKIADFGLARETHSQHPYTTYVSTRWYRAPEVLLRAGEYSAPVDIWAIGAMAVEIANLKPLFPGGNEVDQVWRVCEIMGSPGNWYDKSGNRVGGGDWRDGTRLAQKLGFSFPKMAPHSMETILRPPQWPVALSNFVTWCLMWDPRNRPTSAEAMKHEYFADAVDPLRPISSTSRLVGKKHASVDGKSQRDSNDNPVNSSRPSWFRKSIIRNSSPAVPTQPPQNQIPSPLRSPNQAKTVNVHPVAESTSTMKYRPFASKRATWANGMGSTNAAPMPILPSIRPISPLSDTVTAQAHNNASPPVAQTTNVNSSTETKTSKKIGRQLSVQSNGSHYTDYHRQEAERALNGHRGPASPNGEQKEGFFSHLRKRARRFSGKPQAPTSPNIEDIEASAGCGPWHSNRSSMIIDSNMDTVLKKNFADVEKALQSARSPMEPLSPSPEAPSSYKHQHGVAHTESSLERSLEREPSLSKSVSSPTLDTSSFIGGHGVPISSRTRRALHRSTHPSHIYDTPDEEDELLHEALSSAQNAAKGIDRRTKIEEENYLKRLAQIDNNTRQPLQTSTNSITPLNPYPTPSPSAKRNGILFDQSIMAESVSPSHMVKHQPKHDTNPRWPTPPYEENEWAASAAASIFAAGSMYQ